MEDLVSNKILYKIMWANQEEIIWDMRNEKPISLNDIVYKYLEDFIDYKLWAQEFHDEYMRWLSGESDDLYNIKFKLNSQIIDILPKINKTLNKINIYLFYWFDIDKSVNESFSWKSCPVTNDLLTDLNIKSNNSLICSNCFLVFPKY